MTATSGGQLTAQQRRTRKAIVDAAARLLEAGGTPSVSDVAAEAEVSRRTVYLYFARIEHLLVDAALGRMSESAIEAELDGLDAVSDPEKRVEALVRVVQSHALTTENLGRTVMRLAEPAPQSGGKPPRGYRRVLWIERALEPARTQLTKKKFDELVSQLTMVMGWEALLVLRDVRGLGAEESIEVSVRAARVMVRGALRR